MIYSTSIYARWTPPAQSNEKWYLPLYVCVSMLFCMAIASISRSFRCININVYIILQHWINRKNVYMCLCYGGWERRYNSNVNHKQIDHRQRYFSKKRSNKITNQIPPTHSTFSPTFVPISPRQFCWYRLVHLYCAIYTLYSTRYACAMPATAHLSLPSSINCRVRGKQTWGYELRHPKLSIWSQAFMTFVVYPSSR